jgi:phosphatidylglycerophosphatase A
MFLPVATWPQMIVVAAVQFFVFRAADIVKPPPARQFERLPCGWGVLMDDVMAGVYANLLGQVAVRLVFNLLQLG